MECVSRSISFVRSFFDIQNNIINSILKSWKFKVFCGNERERLFIFISDIGYYRSIENCSNFVGEFWLDVASY